jgi:hypothetical protein
VRGAGGAIDAALVRDELLHIAIDVRVADDQIQGHVSEGAGQPRQFHGWLGLIGELDGLLGSHRPDIPDPADAPAAGEDQVGGGESR